MEPVQTEAVDAESNSRCDVRASFATAFRNWRRRHRIPLKKVAADLGVSIATISKWERGERFPTGNNFERVVNYTGEAPCRLFCIMADQCIPSGCLLAKGRKG